MNELTKLRNAYLKLEKALELSDAENSKRKLRNEVLQTDLKDVRHALAETEIDEAALKVEIKVLKKDKVALNKKLDVGIETAIVEEGLNSGTKTQLADAVKKVKAQVKSITSLQKTAANSLKDIAELKKLAKDLAAKLKVSELKRRKVEAGVPKHIEVGYQIAPGQRVYGSKDAIALLGKKLK